MCPGDSESPPTPHIYDLLVHPTALHRLYGHLPDLSGDLRIRSLNPNPYGPTPTPRVDLPDFPDRPPRKWTDAEADTVLCHLAFMAVQNIDLLYWEPLALGRPTVTVVPQGSGRLRRRAALLRGRGQQLTAHHAPGPGREVLPRALTGWGSSPTVVP